MIAPLLAVIPSILALQWQDGLGLVLAVLALLYLVVVLIYPEKF